MRGVYTGTVIHSALAAAKDLAVLTAPSTKVIEVLRAWIENLTNETNEQLQGILIRVTTAGVGAATAIPKKPHEESDASDTNLKLEHSYATTPPILEADPVARRGFATLSGWEWIPGPRDEILVKPAGILALRIPVTTFTAFDCLAGITWREIG